jgi:polyferredoxin
MLFGALFGRIICGFLCPFGLVQDLIYKLPLPKKWRSRKLLPGDRYLKHLKYILLFLFCILLPMVVVDTFGQGKPWFCAYVCPSGTFLGGIPLIAANEGLRSVLGWLWNWKLSLLIGILLLSLFFYRPFCRYLCPLGAVYGCFNPIALRRFTVEKDKCIDCGKCQKSCPFDLDPSKTPNSAECIRCGRCLEACPTDAISYLQKRK